MSKKETNSVKTVKEVAEPVVAELTKKRRTKKVKAEKTEAEITVHPASEQPTEKETPKRRRLVDFYCESGILSYATEKAQLLCIHDEQGHEVKIWLAKSLMHIIADGDEPGRMICRVPAWLFYKKGLNNYFAIRRWSSVALN